MTPTRTPGPYRVKPVDGYGHALIVGFGGQHVADVWSGRARNMAVSILNAEFLASAESLREALALCYGALTEEGVTERQRKAAIRKAARVLDKTADKGGYQ